MQKIWNHFPLIKYPFYFLLWGAFKGDTCLQLVNLILYNYSILFEVSNTTIDVFIDVFESLMETMKFCSVLFFPEISEVCRKFLYLTFNSLPRVNGRFFIEGLHEKLQIQTLLRNSKHIKWKPLGMWTNVLRRQDKCCHTIVIRNRHKNNIFFDICHRKIRMNTINMAFPTWI